MQLYPYQQRVKDLILNGKSVVLQAPTGSGKTRAALAPFIEGFFDRPATAPRKCVYVTPMRVLANQFYAEYHRLAESYYRRHGKLLDVRIQTGEQPDDRRFEGNLIFCTVDQFLSSYLMMPYSLPYRLANVNAGAFTGAYLVFDEFHLFDPEAALPTILYVLQQLKGLAPVMLMTATFSGDMLQALADLLHPAEIVTLSADEIIAINTRGNKPARQRVWQVADTNVQAATVLASHRHSSMVICNTVRRARELYLDLKQQAPAGTEIILLHSQFLPSDRRRIEERLRKLLGIGASREQVNLIIVATQVVEVGVDISVEILHTELAPPASLIQRAGRCARYPGETGTVIVYPVDKYIPYAFKNDDLLKQEMDSALAWLKERPGQVLDFTDEQALVNAVSTPRDRQVIGNIQADRQNRQSNIHRCLDGFREGASRLLVRDVDSRTLLIHHEPDQLLASPYDAVGLNIPLYSLRSMVKEWLQRPVDVPWRVRRLDESEAGDRLENNRPLYRWVDVRDGRDLEAAALIVVHPALAGYSEQEGFLPNVGHLPFLSTLPPATTLIDRTTLGLRVEPYRDHIQRVLEAFTDLALPELYFAANALERVAGWQRGSVLCAAWLACLFHDVGKLSVGWQQWAHAYQQAIGQPVNQTVALAHTTFDRQNPTHAQAEHQVSQHYQRPRHAAEGALAVACMLAKALPHQELVKATLTAIARHHAPFVQDCQPFKLVDNAKDLIKDTLQFLPKDVICQVNPDMLWQQVDTGQVSQFADLLTRPTNRYGWIAYSLLARALRRADQRGTQMGYLQTVPLSGKVAMNSPIYRGEYYVEKRTATFADNLVAFGVAYVLNGIADGRARITIEDCGPYFAVICDPPLREEWVTHCQFFTGAFLLITVDRKSQQKLIKGTQIAVETVAAMPGIAPDYEQAKSDNETYWAWRRSVGDQWQQLQPPVEPHPDWELFRAINPAALQAANSAAAEWFQGQVAFPELLKTVLIYASAFPNKEEDAAKHWAAVCKRHGLKHSKQLSASQLINPTQGKGTTNSKAIFAKPGNLSNFWLTEYLKWVGLRWAGFTRLIKDSKDRKIYVLAPNRLDWEHHLGIREQFRRLMIGTGGAIQLDILAALRYAKAVLSYAEVSRDQSAQVFGGNNRSTVADCQRRGRDQSLLAQVFGTHQGVNRLVYGLDSAYYKNLGQSAAVMNIARIGIPSWIQPQTQNDISRYQAVIDEHLRIVRNLDEKRGEEYELLRSYRDFLSTNELATLLAFTDAYSGFVIQRDKLAPQFTVHSLEVIMSSIAPPLSEITKSRGFRNLAYAIRMATVEAHRRNLKRNQDKYDVSYEVRYGLGQELLRKSAYPNEFIIALSEFIHDYNAENARMRERLERQGNSQPRGARSDVSIQDIDELLALMDKYRDPQMIASLLVAYGYASTYQRDETYTPERDTDEANDQDAGSTEELEEE